MFSGCAANSNCIRRFSSRAFPEHLRIPRDGYPAGFPASSARSVAVSQAKEALENAFCVVGELLCGLLQIASAVLQTLKKRRISVAQGRNETLRAGISAGGLVARPGVRDPELHFVNCNSPVSRNLKLDICGGYNLTVRRFVQLSAAVFLVSVHTFRTKSIPI